jgi:LacI family transcriptional regulator
MLPKKQAWALQPLTGCSTIGRRSGREIRSAVRVVTAKADKAQLIEAMEKVRIDIFVGANLP